MDADDHVCLCFRVSLRKLRTYMLRENPPVASLLSECFGAGTGCQWCVPFLKHLHAEHQAGRTPDLKISPQQYTESRSAYRATGTRDESVLRDGTTPPSDEPRDDPQGDTDRNT